MNKLKSRKDFNFLPYDKRNEAMNTRCFKFFVSLVLFVKPIISASSAPRAVRMAVQSQFFGDDFSVAE